MKIIHFVSAVLVACTTMAQQYPSGPQVLSFHSDVDDTEQPYACYIPKKYKANKAYPLVVMLHGAGSNHRLAMRRVFGKSNAAGENDVEASLYFPAWKDVEYIVISPNARGTMGYQGIAEKDVWDMIADTKSRFKIDESRMYLTGLSMGGGGTLWIGLTRADVWAAIAPVCPAAPTGTDVFLNNVIGKPVHFFQGDADPAVKVEGTRKWVEDFKKAGALVEYVEYPGVGHDSWVNAYKDGFIFDWFSKFRNNKYPSKVNFSSNSMKYDRAYWIQLNQKIPGQTAVIKAEFMANNIVQVYSENVESISLDLVSHPLYKKALPLSVNINGQSFKYEKVNEVIHLTKNFNEWSKSKAAISSATNEGSVISGPMTEVFSDRHIYVYGTMGNASKEEIAKRRAVAEEAANWSIYKGDFIGRVMVFPRVLSDVELRPNDIERSNLVLFGDAETNAQIKKYTLPITLNSAKETSSLTVLIPNGNKYVLVNSGLPFWEIPNLDRSPFASLLGPGKTSTLFGYGDYVLYDKLSQKITHGYFNNDWTIADKSELLKNPQISVK